MGYNTRVTGEITFEPPIPWGAARDDEYLRGWDGGSTKCIRLRVEEATVETDEGTLTRRSVVGIVPISEDSFKAYDIDAEVQEVVSRYCAPGGRECRGRLEGEGEDSGDLWRLYVRSARNGREYEVVRDVPRIVWPDGDIQEGRG